jgi:hypothetical protein
MVLAIVGGHEGGHERLRDRAGRKRHDGVDRGRGHGRGGRQGVQAGDRPALQGSGGLEPDHGRVEVPTGTFDILRGAHLLGVFDLPLGVFDVPLGVFDL